MDVRITVDDYHRWLGELYAQTRAQALALQRASTALDAVKEPEPDGHSDH